MSVIALASILATQGQVSLTFNPKVGSSYKFSNTSVAANPMSGGNQTTSFTSTMKVVSNSGGYFKIDISSSNVKISGDEQASAQMKKVMEGKHQTITIDKFGTPKADPKDTSGGMKAIMEGFNNQSVGVVFPKKPVKVGETWTSSVDLGAAMNKAMTANGGKAGGAKGKGMLKTTYKLVKIDGKSATITSSISGTMDMDMGGGKAGGPQGMKMSMTFSGSGNMNIERATGVPFSTSMKMNMGIMGRTMPMSTTSKRI